MPFLMSSLSFSGSACAPAGLDAVKLTGAFAGQIAGPSLNADLGAISGREHFRRVEILLDRGVFGLGGVKLGFGQARVVAPHGRAFGGGFLRCLHGVGERKVSEGFRRFADDDDPEKLATAKTWLLPSSRAIVSHGRAPRPSNSQAMGTSFLARRLGRRDAQAGGDGESQGLSARRTRRQQARPCPAGP